eukprot:4990307-Alexandrium_andersonii.AAC.1
MGPGDTCLLVNWNARPINQWSMALGSTRPCCAELSAGPGPDTTALPWRVAISQAKRTELHFWAGVGSQRRAGSGQTPA